VEVCLVRHAIAVERGSPGNEDDGLRPLTPRGRARMEEAAQGLKRLFVPQVIVTSPLVRARETADILLAAYGLQKTRICDALASGNDVELLRELDDVDSERIVCVGHEPHISNTLSWLLTGEHDMMSAVFKKGAAALVSSSDRPGPGHCALEWLVQPATLRAIAMSPR
jgi:phosphohistidine phosphatase